LSRHPEPRQQATFVSKTKKGPSRRTVVGQPTSTHQKQEMHGSEQQCDISYRRYPHAVAIAELNQGFDSPPFLTARVQSLSGREQDFPFVPTIQHVHHHLRCSRLLPTSLLHLHHFLANHLKLLLVKDHIAKIAIPHLGHVANKLCCVDDGSHHTDIWCSNETLEIQYMLV
jgi:hypothetical protein